MTEPYRLDTLQAIEVALWQELAQAATDPRHAWRRCVVATVGPDGGPEARTMVLRECEATTRRLALFTDARSPKRGQLAHDARAHIVCWSPQLNWQLRLRCRIEIETEGLGVSARWARVRCSPSAQDYLSHLPPGAPLAGPGDPAVHADAVAHHHFAVLNAEVLSIDWLELHPQGHRRAVFEAGEGAWRVP